MKAGLGRSPETVVRENEDNHRDSPRVRDIDVSGNSPSARLVHADFPQPAYDTMGLGYQPVRQPDPRLASRITAALGDSRTVINVGAGAGSYEPVDRWVLAVEPAS